MFAAIIYLDLIEEESYNESADYSTDNVFSIDGVSRNGEYISEILKEYEDDLAF